MNIQNRHSVTESRLGTVEEIMALTDSVALNLTNANYDLTLKSNIKNLHSFLKLYGSKLEAVYKGELVNFRTQTRYDNCVTDQLDRSFVAFRNGSRDDGLDYESRRCLLELIELRAMQWSAADNSYYKHKMMHDLDAVTTPVLENSFSHSPIFAVSKDGR